MNEFEECDSINKLLIKAKKKSLSHQYPKCLDSRHCAFIVSGGRIIAVGYNKLSNQELRFAETAVSRRPKTCEHAELQAIMSIRKKIDLTNTKMFVVRVNRAQEFSMSRPCKHCAEAIPKYGIRTVYYSISDSEYGVWNVKKQFERQFKQTLKQKH